LIFSQTSKPLMSGSFTSSTTRSMPPSSNRASASDPVAASITVWPARRSQLAST
jgi:hypothetical protein